MLTVLLNKYNCIRSNFHILTVLSCQVGMPRGLACSVDVAYVLLRSSYVPHFHLGITACRQEPTLTLMDLITWCHWCSCFTCLGSKPKVITVSIFIYNQYDSGPQPICSPPVFPPPPPPPAIPAFPGTGEVQTCWGFSAPLSSLAVPVGRRAPPGFQSWLWQRTLISSPSWMTLSSLTFSSALLHSRGGDVLLVFISEVLMWKLLRTAGRPVASCKAVCPSQGPTPFSFYFTMPHSTSVTIVVAGWSRSLPTHLLPGYQPSPRVTGRANTHYLSSWVQQ